MFVDSGFLARLPVTLTVPPIFNVSFRQPARNRASGAPPSPEGPVFRVGIGGFDNRVNVGISPVHFLHLAGERWSWWCRTPPKPNGAPHRGCGRRRPTPRKAQEFICHRDLRIRYCKSRAKSLMNSRLGAANAQSRKEHLLKRTRWLAPTPTPNQKQRQNSREDPRKAGARRPG